MAISIAYICSILLVNHDFKNKPPNEQWDTQQNIGTFLIEDFDVAMKSKLPAEYFRNYLMSCSDHYRNVLAPAIYGKSS